MAPPAFAAPANLKISPAPLAGLQCRPLQAIDSGLRKHFIAISKFHRRGEHCLSAKALQCRKAPRVEQSPTPTINRERVRLNFSAISQFHRRGGAWLRPALPQLRTPKISPAPLAGLPCRPLQAIDSGWRKYFVSISKFHRRGEHCSPAKALWCRMAFRVEQSPTPTMGRERCV